MNIVEIIEKKKRGEELSLEEISFAIEGVLSGSVKDYQMSALLMAICLKGMTPEETTSLTMVMRDSGDILDLSSIGKTVVDKHSTGGVGDKTTLIVGPIMASLGIPVAKMSGRGLGITGGTIDKLDSIPGFSSDVSDAAFIRQVKDVGIVDAAQNLNLAPADKVLYALRDVTGTVDSVPLIASSIMSKKLASGADGIVLDVKCGSGAFMTDESSACELANAMLEIAHLAGKKCTAVISDMNQPLGYTVGNLLEVIEAVRFLTGTKQEPRLYKLVIELCKQMYKLSDEYIKLNKSNEYLDENGSRESDSIESDSIESDSIEINSKIEEIIKDELVSGKAYNKFKEFISAQNGDISFIEKLEEDIKVKPLFDEERSLDITAVEAGFITGINAHEIGRASLMLGAGRETKDSKIDLYSGIVFRKVVGDKVSSGDSIATLYSASSDKLEQAKKLVQGAITVSDTFDERDIIIDVLA
ncbi:pyrimidine-nucleoside phosphorylase [Lachnospiraceae bacterium NE2001]|nr:pyrimidine-nucleoside phosphorylase [Lachnospiraceae bacterium NE2001]